MSEPLDEAATKRALIRLAIAVTAWVVPVYVLLRWQGIGGLSLGWALCALPLAGGAALIAAILARHLPTWYSYPAAAAAIGAVLSFQLAQVAPLGTDRLGDYVDSLGLEGKVVEERATGSPSCKPACPRLVRVYELPYTRTNVGQTVTETTLIGEGFAARDIMRDRDSFTVENEVVAVEARFTRQGPGVRAELAFTAKRR